MDLYGKLRERARGAPKFVLHDGPPLRQRPDPPRHARSTRSSRTSWSSRSRWRASTRPTCPATTATACRSSCGSTASSARRSARCRVAEFRRACRAYAERFIGVMTRGVPAARRLRRRGTSPYLTMDFRYQADIVRALGKFVERGLVYKGKKPVHWCIHCRTALAEAEVEYADHTSPSIYVEFPLAPASAAALGRTRARTGGPERLGADLDDDAVDHSVEPGDRVPSGVRLRGLRRRRHAPSSWPKSWRRRCRPAVGQSARRAGRARSKGAALEGIRFRHPLYARDSVGRARPTTSRSTQGTGAVHTAPGHGADDFLTGVQLRPRDLRADRTRRRTSSTRWSCSPACACSTPTPKVEEALHERAAPVAPRGRSRTSIRTAGAATTR